MTLYFNNSFGKQPLPEVARAMLPFLRDHYHNPLTDTEDAEAVRSAEEKARKHAAALLNARADELFFVSSGTEANNWALKGIASTGAGGKKHLVISAIEHFSTYQTAEYLSRNGFELCIVPVDRAGRIDPEDVARSIRPETFLVSVLAGSDEIGVTQDLPALSVLKHRFPEVIFHTDAVQYLCYETLDVQALPFDLVSLSSNALFGPAGIAALYIRNGTRIVPLLHGGMQEGGRRPGLQSAALIAGFGAAAEANLREKGRWKRDVQKLQSRLVAALAELQAPVTGSTDHRLVDNVHAVVDVDGEALLTLLLSEGICAGTGSTCYRYARKESHVLRAIGMDRQAARGAVLFTLGIDHTEEDIHVLAGNLERSLRHLRLLKPV
jgi:cysteine desulfurase